MLQRQANCSSTSGSRFEAPVIFQTSQIDNSGSGPVVDPAPRFTVSHRILRMRKEQNLSDLKVWVVRRQTRKLSGNFDESSPIGQVHMMGAVVSTAVNSPHSVIAKH